MKSPLTWTILWVEWRKQNNRWRTWKNGVLIPKRWYARRCTSKTTYKQNWQTLNCAHGETIFVYTRFQRGQHAKRLLKTELSLPSTELGIQRFFRALGTKLPQAPTPGQLWFIFWNKESRSWWCGQHGNRNKRRKLLKGKGSLLPDTSKTPTEGLKRRGLIAESNGGDDPNANASTSLKKLKTTSRVKVQRNWDSQPQESIGQAIRTSPSCGRFYLTFSSGYKWELYTPMVRQTNNRHCEMNNTKEVRDSLLFNTFKCFLVWITAIILSVGEMLMLKQ